MLLVAIAACEFGFWVVLFAGLGARYLLRWRRASTVILAGVHVINLALLVVTFADLRQGTTATLWHGLAAVYLGFTLAFGHSMVRWADQRFARRFAGGPPPVKPPRHGPARRRHEWREFGKALLAAAVAAVLLAAGIAVVGDPDRTAALLGWFPRLGVVLVIWFATGPLYRTIWPGHADPPSGPVTG